MRVREVMTSDPVCCLSTDTAQKVAQLLREENVGALPVIADNQSLKLIGMITDRDICMAGAMRNQSLSQISVEEIMNKRVFAAELDEHIDHALQTMREHQIRRLPVLDAEGELSGIVSMNDIVLHAKARNGKKPAIDYADVVKTYQAICSHPVPMVQEAAAK